MITDGVQLCELYERETATGETFLFGMWGNAAIVVIADEARPGTWRVLATDPAAGQRSRGASLVRSLARPADDDTLIDDDTMDDSIPADAEP